MNLLAGGLKFSQSENYFYYGGASAQYQSLDVAYGFKIGTSSVLTAGAEYNFGEPKIYEETLSGEYKSFKQRQRYGVFLAPGLAVSKEALLYAKLGWNQARADIVPEGNSANFRAYGYGAGSKLMISNQVYIKVEAIRQTFNSKTIDTVTNKPSATVGTIGVGISF